MFAVKPRIEIAVRVLLIVGIVFNVCITTPAFVQAKGEESSTGNSSAQILNRINKVIPTFDRPKPRVGERPEQISLENNKLANMLGGGFANLHIESRHAMV